VIITNKHGLPESLVSAVRNDPYSPGDSDITVTSLIGPPQIRVLNKKHADEIEEDAIDRIWSLLGQAVHTILERADDLAIKEKRLYADIAGWKVGGQLDRLAYLPDGTLEDYKVTSAWTHVFGNKIEWEQQLNCLALLLFINGYPVKRLQVTAIYRDWSKSKALQDKGYPQAQVGMLKIPMWSHEKAIQYIHGRVLIHQDADDGEVLPCTDKERWLRGTTWAVMKKGRKRALRVYPTREQCVAWCYEHGHVLKAKGKESLANNITIEHRPGTYMRCESYCSVAKFCPQWRRKNERRATTETT